MTARIPRCTWSTVPDANTWERVVQNVSMRCYTPMPEAVTREFLTDRSQGSTSGALPGQVAALGGRQVLMQSVDGEEPVLRSLTIRTT